MSRSEAFEQLDDWSIPDASLEACDESQSLVADATGDQPRALLAAFALHMAAHGWPVRPALMQCDRDYALWQLARARGIDDPTLKQLAARLFDTLTRRT